jgi:phosphoribosylglycinamide formyltransferase-1
MKNVLFLASGRGSNFQSFVDHIRLGVLRDVAIKGLICNHKGARVLERARSVDVQTYEIEGVAGRTFDSALKKDEARLAFDNECVSVADSLGIDFVVLTGFDQIITKSFTDSFPFRILNIHPAYDLKRFGGKNMLGEKVHQAVVDNKAPYSGCAIHFVTSDVDQGPVVLKKRVDLLPNDSADTLASRILEQEHLAFPEALQLLVDNRVKTEESGRRCYVDRYSDGWDVNWFDRQQEYVRFTRNLTLNAATQLK